MYKFLNSKNNNKDINIRRIYMSEKIIELKEGINAHLIKNDK